MKLLTNTAMCLVLVCHRVIKYEAKGRQRKYNRSKNLTR